VDLFRFAAIAALAGLALTIVAGIGTGSWYVAKLDDRLARIEDRVSTLEAQVSAVITQDRTPDPLAQACADLAQRSADAPANSYEADRLQAAMASAGCNAPRK
jgi:hypothetical protein